MMKIALVCDGSCDLPPDIVSAHGLVVVPQHVIWNGITYSDGVDITNREFYERLAYEPNLPKTAQPSAGEFADAYRRACQLHRADAVLCITLSQKLSGTYNSANSAREMVDFPVCVLDSRTATIAMGLIVLAVADTIDKGEITSFEEAEKTVQGAADNSRFLFTLNTLDFLYRGGRIGGAQRLIGTALSIKPILNVEHGAVEAFENIRTRKKAVARLVEIAREYKTCRPLRVGVINTIAPETAELTAILQDILKPEQMVETMACSAVGVYAGPGGLGFGLVYGF